MARRPDTPCARCGQLLWTGRTSLLNPICRPCRRVQSAPTTHSPTWKSRAHTIRCGWCAHTITCYPNTPRKYCSRICFGQAQGNRARIRPTHDHRSQRWQRDKDTPGLAPAARTRLLRTWQQQHRPCSYCPAPATTVDHVIPLVRGGTNYEGNLAPCCRRCNSSKAAKLLIEWRHAHVPGRVAA